MPLPPPRRPSIVTMLAASLFALAAGSLVLTFPVDVAQAQGPHPGPPAGAALVVNAEVMVLLATQLPGSGSIDPAIGNLPQLRKPPLSAYNTYHLLDKRSVAVPLGRSGTYTLANGRVLQVTFVEPTADHGFHVKAAINNPGHAAYLKL